jgi:phage N-6-adenine-methyltransferase
MVSNAILTPGGLNETNEWGTPQQMFDKLDQEFGFTVDVAASDSNHKCEKYFTIANDGLQNSWDGVAWMNPPYGRVIKAWMRKAYEESLKGNTVVCLIPARTDTAWWHDYAMKGEIRFIRGRIKFVRDGGDGGFAPFPSAIVVFRGLSG